MHKDGDLVGACFDALRHIKRKALEHALDFAIGQRQLRTVQIDIGALVNAAKGEPTALSIRRALLHKCADGIHCMNPA